VRDSAIPDDGCTAFTALGRREARNAVADFYRDIGRAPIWAPGIETI